METDAAVLPAALKSSCSCPTSVVLPHPCGALMPTWPGAQTLPRNPLNSSGDERAYAIRCHGEWLLTEEAQQRLEKHSPRPERMIAGGRYGVTYHKGGRLLTQGGVLCAMRCQLLAAPHVCRQVVVEDARPAVGRLTGCERRCRQGCTDRNRQQSFESTSSYCCFHRWLAQRVAGPSWHSPFHVQATCRRHTCTRMLFLKRNRVPIRTSARCLGSLGRPGGGQPARHRVCACTGRAPNSYPQQSQIR